MSDLGRERKNANISIYQDVYKQDDFHNKLGAEAEIKAYHDESIGDASAIRRRPLGRKTVPLVKRI